MSLGGGGGRHYALCLFEGAARIVLRMPNEGIALTPDGLAWSIGGQQRTRRHADIRKVWLSVGHLHKVGSVGQCRIRFADGTRLNVLSSTPWGYVEEEHSARYAGFVRDFHARLCAMGLRGIEFRAGNTEGKQAFGRVVLVVAAGLFVVLPVGLFLFLGAWQGLLIAAAGGGLVWPVLQTIRANEPRYYAPDRVPEDLLP